MDTSLYRTEPFRAIPGAFGLLLLMIVLLIFPAIVAPRKDQDHDQDHEQEYLPIASGGACFYAARVLELERALI